MDQAVEFFVRHGNAVLFAWIFAEQAGLPIPTGARVGPPLHQNCFPRARNGRITLREIHTGSQFRCATSGRHIRP